MIGFLWNLLLALAWATLSGNFSGPSFLFGFVLGYGLLALLERELPILHGYSRRLPRFIMFLGFFIKELVKANFKVAFDVATPLWYMKPGVIALPITAETDVEITILANFISLTPGTLILDVSSDRRVLFIHAMFLYDEDEVIAELQEIERRVLEILR